MTQNIINIIISVILMLALSHCDNRQQTKQTEEDIAGKKESERVSTVVKTKSLRDIRESKYRLTTEEIIVNELKVVMDEYQYSDYNLRPIPSCDGCSDLELLLILEKALDKRGGWMREINPASTRENIKGVSYLEKEDEARIKDKLKKVETKYEKWFESPVPWWWMCSVEERIRRLEEAVETGRYYVEITGAGYRPFYKRAKNMAAYELWFNKPFPKCSFFCEEQHLEQALEADFPFHSNEEDAELKTRLKTEYQKRFGDSIPDTVLSMARVYFDNGKRDEYTLRISVTRTATGGAIAKYRARTRGSPLLELKLSIGDWLDFINALYKFVPEWQIDKQEKERREKKLRISGGRHGTPGNCWEFRIYFWNREQYCLGDIEVLADSSCHYYYLYKWEGFEELINNMAERIKKYGKTSYD